MEADRKTETDKDTSPAEGQARQHIDDEIHAQMDSTNLEAVKEAARLGGDNFLVETDLEDKEQREDGDQPDGRASPMANADNQER